MQIDVALRVYQSQFEISVSYHFAAGVVTVAHAAGVITVAHADGVVTVAYAAGVVSVAHAAGVVTVARAADDECVKQIICWCSIFFQYFTYFSFD